MSAESSLVIRRATCNDLRQVLAWLRREEAQGVEGSFYCNHIAIEEGPRDGSLYVLLENGRPTAFALGLIGILAVRSDRRGHGLGTLLANDCIERAGQQGLPGIMIECSPRTSVPFWKALRFEVLPETDRGIRAYRLIHRSVVLPSDRPSGTVRITLEHEGSGEIAHGPVEIRAAEIERAQWLLAERFVAWTPGGSDALVKIHFDGQLVSHAKVKYSLERGLRYQTEFCWLDSLSIVGLSGRDGW